MSKRMLADAQLVFPGASRLLSVLRQCCPRLKPRAALHSSGLTGIYGFAVPVRVEVCVPARSLTEMVAVFAPVVCVVSGLNCTVTTQAAPGAKVV